MKPPTLPHSPLAAASTKRFSFSIPTPPPPFGTKSGSEADSLRPSIRLPNLSSLGVGVTFVTAATDTLLRGPGLFRVATPDGSMSLQYDAKPSRDQVASGYAGKLTFEFPADSQIAKRLMQGSLERSFSSATNPVLSGGEQALPYLGGEALSDLLRTAEWADARPDARADEGVFKLGQGESFRMVAALPAAASRLPVSPILGELLKEAPFRALLRALSDALKMEENAWESRRHLQASDLAFYHAETRPALESLLARAPG